MSWEKGWPPSQTNVTNGAKEEGQGLGCKEEVEESEVALSLFENLLSLTIKGSCIIVTRPVPSPPLVC